MNNNALTNKEEVCEFGGLSQNYLGYLIDDLLSSIFDFTKKEFRRDCFTRSFQKILREKRQLKMKETVWVNTKEIVPGQSFLN